MEAQILRAGPNLIFMVEIRWSSRRSSNACPSISCDRKWAASSSQPGQKQRNRKIQLTWLELTNTKWTQLRSNHSPPTLKWRDKPADFFHTPLSRSCWEEVSPLQWEAARCWAVRRRSAVLCSGAGVWRAWGKWRRIVLLFFLSVAGYILWATRLRVTLDPKSRHLNTKAKDKNFRG